MMLLTCRGPHHHLGKKHDINDVVPVENFMKVGELFYAVSLHKDLLAAKIIQETKVFVLNRLSEKYKSAFEDAGRHSGEFHDKLSLLNLTAQSTEKILDCFSIKEAEEVFECEVINSLKVQEFIVFFGKVQ